MKTHSANSEKENRHPNRKVTEEDISKIAKSYVFDGQRVKAKSILYREQSPSLPSTPQTTSKQPTFTQEDLRKLQYLQNMNVLTPAEQKTLQQLRKMPQFSSQRVREPLSNVVSEQHSHYAPQNCPPFQHWEQPLSDYEFEEQEYQSSYEPTYEQSHSDYQSEGFQQRPYFPYQQNCAKQPRY